MDDLLILDGLDEELIDIRSSWFFESLVERMKYNSLVDAFDLEL